MCLAPLMDPRPCLQCCATLSALDQAPAVRLMQAVVHAIGDQITVAGSNPQQQGECPQIDHGIADRDGLGTPDGSPVPANR